MGLYPSSDKKANKSFKGGVPPKHPSSKFINEIFDILESGFEEDEAINYIEQSKHLDLPPELDNDFESKQPGSSVKDEKYQKYLKPFYDQEKRQLKSYDGMLMNNNIVTYQSKYRQLKDFILDDIKLNGMERDITDDALKIIKNYLDIRIDDAHGILKEEDYVIEFQEFVDFCDMNKGNAEILKEKITNKKHEYFEEGFEYKIQYYDDAGLDKRLFERDTSDTDGMKEKRYSHVYLNVISFIQLLFDSRTKNAELISVYFLQMESMQLSYMRNQLHEEYDTKDYEKMQLRMLTRLKKEFRKRNFDTKRFMPYIKKIVEERELEFDINIRELFEITIRSKELKDKNTHFNYFKKDILRELYDEDYEERDGEIYVNMMVLKWWLLRYDKRNQYVYSFRYYFIIMEELALKTLEKEFNQFQQMDKRLTDKMKNSDLADNACYFYIIWITDDTFKFGRTSSLLLRIANYNVGRQDEIKFLCHIRFSDAKKPNRKCHDFEKEFGELMKNYKIKGKRELICIDENVLMFKLEKLLSRFT